METKGDDLILTPIFCLGNGWFSHQTRQFFSSGGGGKFEEENHLGIALIFSMVAILNGCFQK